MIQFAWRFLIHQKNSALAEWYQASVAAGKKRKTMARTIQNERQNCSRFATP
jgi:hypothetical protein